MILEYNGTWSLEALMQHELPAAWEFAQIITPVNAETFDLYIKNMRQMMVEASDLRGPDYFQPLYG